MKTTFKALSKVALVIALILIAMLVITSCGEDKCENHTWDNGTVQNASTCTQDGTMLYTCKDCGETKTEPIKGSHNYVKNVVEPTCTVDGMTIYTCSNCNHTYNENVVKAEHVYVITNIDATCTTPGETRKECSRCGDTQIETVLSHHDYVKTSTVATCTQDGIDTFTCSKCNDSYRVIAVRSTGHVTEGCTWVVSSEPSDDESCKFFHIETTQCKTCGESVSVSEEYYKHTYNTSITVSATCQSQGTKVYTCTLCEDTYEEGFADVNAHNWDEGTVDGNITTYACTNGECAKTREVFSAKNETAATVPSDALQSAGEVELLGASVKLDKDVLEQLGTQDVTISADTLNDDALDAILGLLSEEDKAKLGSNKIYDFTLSQNDSLVSEFNGYITLTIRYDLNEGEDPDNIAIWYINDEGKPDTYEATYCEINGLGYAQFETNHFSYYTVVRMSPEERCALYGHKYIASVVDPSCNQEGYTIERCRTCSDIKRHTFTPALTHSYTQTVVDATCTQKGYTLNTCPLCNDVYISNQTPVIAHTYESTVVNPTCTQKGYTLVKCKSCGDSYTQKEVSALGHTYVNGVCSTCNKEATSTDKSYLALMDSIFTADTYFLSIDNLKVVVSQKNSNSISALNLFSLNAVVGFDDLGYLEGKGTAKLEMQADGTTVSVDATVVFANKRAYVYYAMDTDVPSSNFDEGTFLGCAQQDFFIEEMMGSTNASLEAVFGMLKEYTYIWDDIANKDNNPLNKVIEKIVGYMFIKTEKADGNIYTFNPAMALSIYETLRDFTVSETFDKVFGTGAYDATVDFIKNSANKTIKEFEGEIITELGKWGIAKETVYTLVFQIAGLEMEGFVEENKDVTVLEFVSAMMENELTVEDYNAMVDEYAQGFKQIKLVEMIYSSIEGAPEFDKENDPVHDEITKVIEALGKAEYKFTTNRDNELVSVSFNLNQFVYSFTQNSADFEISANGKITITANETLNKDFDNLLEEIDAIEKATKPEKPVIVDNAFKLIANDGKLYIWKLPQNKNDMSATVVLSKEELAKEIYNGVSATKYAVVIMNLYVCDSTYINAYKDCLGWYEIGIEAKTERNFMNAYAWYDEQGEIIGVSANTEDLELDRWDYLDFYYNLEKNEYSATSRHSFKYIETIEPNGCVYGREIYLCSACGTEKYERLGEGHNYMTKAELLEGSKTCTDGIKVTKYCSKCNEVFYTDIAKSHRTATYDKVLENASVCGDVVFTYEKCPCGQEAFFIDTEKSDCIFDYVGSDNGKDIYRCAINECAFTYYRSNVGEYTYHPEKEDTCWYSTSSTFTLESGEVVLTYSRSYPSHNRVIQGETSADGGYCKSTCTLCNTVIYEETYDEYGRTLFYRNSDGENWSRVYTGCDYIQTDNNTGKTQEGTNHSTTHQTSGGSCSQYSYTSWICRVCGFVESSSFTPPSTWVDKDTHYWYYNADKKMYICNICGTESATGANAYVVLEDMVSKQNISIGYFDKNGYGTGSFMFEIVFNYQADGSGILLENSEDYLLIEDTTPYDYNGKYFCESGIVTINRNMLADAINNCEEDVSTVSLVVSVFNGEDWIAHALTFSLEELYLSK